MENLKLQEKWKEITREINIIPNFNVPYKKEIIATRELLLFAQLILSKIEMGDNINFHENLFSKIMSKYYKQKKSLHL